MHVYDKAKYHDDTIHSLGLPEEHSTHHTLFFFRWLVEHDLISDEFRKTGAEILAGFHTGAASAYDLYEWWDNCLVSDMLSDQGNAFAMTYFDFERGSYLADYVRVLQRHLPTEFHVKFTEENYRKLSRLIDERFRDWQAGQ